jgi:hypothetical protein
MRLERRKKELEELSAQIEREEYEIGELDSARKKLLVKLNNNRIEIFRLRKDFIQRTNKLLSEFVRIKIEYEMDNSNYIRYLVDDVLSSSDYRINKSSRELVARKIHPLHLAELVKQGDTGTLSDKADISLELVEKVITLVRPKRYEIETFYLEDKITIEINDRGWKELASCSDGQKCTAILSIALCERDIPLIIDQPEDSLDNAFIYEGVVRIVRNIKNKRQLIIATHNANIPVLGDSELILVMTSNGKNGFITERGVIDKDRIKTYAQNILEGGKDAFVRRKAKYGI